MQKYAKTILSAYPMIDNVIMQIEKLIRNKARNSFYLYDDTMKTVEQILRLGEIAKLLGMSDKNIFIMANGKTLEVDANSARIGQQVQAGIVLVDGLGVGDVGNIVLRDRQHLAEDGIMIVVLTLEKGSNELQHNIHSRKNSDIG